MKRPPITISEREIAWLLREKYHGERTLTAEKDIARLRRGEHISYVIGWTPFLDCIVDLSARPLIPRPETEYWTEQIIQTIKRSASGQAPPRVLDLFCGSGCIGIAVLKHVPRARVNFADIDKKYFPGIRKSLRGNEIDTRCARCIHSNVFEKIGARKYDYILANPPYIPTAGRAVAKSVLAQEPSRALFAGADGLRYIRKLLHEAKKHLNPRGTMVIEFDPPQKAAIVKLAAANGWQAEFHKDQYGRWRWVALTGLC